MLDTLEKIEKSVENSLVHEGSGIRGYFAVGTRGEDGIVEGTRNMNNYHSNKGQLDNYQSNREQRMEHVRGIEKAVLFDDESEE